MADIARMEWMKDIVVKGLGSTPRAFDHMMKTQDGVKKLLDALYFHCSQIHQGSWEAELVGHNVSCYFDPPAAYRAI